MKSKTFLNKSLKSRMKGQLWIPIFLAIGFFFAFPVAELIAMGNWTEYGYNAAQLADCYQNMWQDGFLFTGGIITFVAAFINGVNGYWYLYSSAKVDFYHCLPVKRSRMFEEKAVTGSLSFLFPYLVMEFFAIRIGALRGYFSLALMGMAVKMLLIHFLMYLMVYFSVVLAITLTGNMLMGALMFLGIMAYGPVLAVLIEGAKSSFFATVSYGRGGIGNILGMYFSPITLSVNLIDSYQEKNMTKILLIILGIILLLGVVSFLAYKKRPMEAAGKSVVYPFVKIMLEFMVVIPSGLGIGLIFHTITEGKRQDIWYGLGIVLGTVLVHGMLQIIFSLDFRRFFGAKLQLILAGGMVILLALVFRFDLFGYDAYIPEYEKLQKIEIDGYGLTKLGRNNSYVKEQEDGSYTIEPGWNETGKSKSFYHTMKDVIEGQKARKKDTTGVYRNTILVQYTTTSGKIRERQYTVSNEEIRQILGACYENGQMKERVNSFLNIDMKYLESVTGEFFASDGAYTLFQGDRDMQEALVEALKQDSAEADTEVLMGNPLAYLSFVYKDVPNSKGGTEYLYMDMMVYPEYERTLAILKETGYPVTLDELEIEYVDVSAENRDADEALTGEPWRIEEQSRLEEIKAGLVSSHFAPDWIDIEDRIVLLVKFKESQWEKNMWLLKAEEPSFLTEFVEKKQKICLRDHRGRRQLV